MFLINCLLLISALSLSSVAAYFSVIGLGIMFPGSVSSVILMALVLEVSKIVCAIWTHLNWKNVSIFSKFYLSLAVFILMAITSMGIFGFLSKSHIQHSKQAKENAVLIEKIDNDIARENFFIQRQNDYLKDLDEASKKSSDKNVFNIDLERENISQIENSTEKSVNLDLSLISDYKSRLSELDKKLYELESSPRGLFSSKSKKIEALKLEQKEEVDSLNQKIISAESRIQSSRDSSNEKINEILEKIESSKTKLSDASTSLSVKSEYDEKIKESYERIDSLEFKKFEYQSSQLDLEAEVGPVKYVSELLSDFGLPALRTEDSIRFIILIIVCVFDPLAIVMVICASAFFFKNQKKNF